MWGDSLQIDDWGADFSFMGGEKTQQLMDREVLDPQNWEAARKKTNGSTPWLAKPLGKIIREDLFQVW